MAKSTGLASIWIINFVKCFSYPFKVFINFIFDFLLLLFLFLLLLLCLLLLLLLPLRLLKILLFIITNFIFIIYILSYFQENKHSLDHSSLLITILIVFLFPIQIILIAI